MQKKFKTDYGKSCACVPLMAHGLAIVNAYCNVLQLPLKNG
jgi:hypothetical protein